MAFEVIPAGLLIDPRPGSTRDGIDALEISDEEQPSVLTGGENCLIAVPNARAEFVPPQVIPDVFDRIEFRRVRRQRQQRDVVWNAQSFALLVPTGAVAYDDGVCTACHLDADLLEMFRHCLSVDCRHDDRRTNFAVMADGTE